MLEKMLGKPGIKKYWSNDMLADRPSIAGLQVMRLGELCWKSGFK
jgi:hypothetical protein